MSWKFVFPAIAAGLVILGGCGDDPPSSSQDLSSSVDASTGSDAGSLTLGDAADAPYDAGFRDPRASDGGCIAPNKLCPGNDGGMICVAVGTDKTNCGACGTVCVGDGATCTASRCACTGTLMDYCGTSGCQDVSSDTNNCGSCGNVCDPSQFDACESGSCVMSQR